MGLDFGEWGQGCQKIFDAEFLGPGCLGLRQEGGTISEVSGWFQNRLSSVFWLEPREAFGDCFEGEIVLEAINLRFLFTSLFSSLDKAGLLRVSLLSWFQPSLPKWWDRKCLCGHLLCCCLLLIMQAYWILTPILSELLLVTVSMLTLFKKWPGRFKDWGGWASTAVANSRKGGLNPGSAVTCKYLWADYLPL